MKTVPQASLTGDIFSSLEHTMSTYVYYYIFKTSSVPAQTA